MKAALGLVGAGVLINHSLYTVQGGHRAVIFSRWSGVQKEVEADGTHFLIPFLQYPTIYDIRSKPKVRPTLCNSCSHSLSFFSPLFKSADGVFSPAIFSAMLMLCVNIF